MIPFDSNDVGIIVIIICTKSILRNAACEHVHTTPFHVMRNAHVHNQSNKT